MSSISRCVLLAIGLLIGAIIGKPAQAEPVMVSMHTGRTVSGEVDSRSNAQALWIRSSQENISVAVAIAWEHVEHVEWKEQRLTSAQFAERVEQLQTAETTAMFLAPRPLKIARTAKKHSGDSLDSPPQVVAIDVYAELRNWDRDVEPDGIELFVAPLDAWGHLVPVKGNLMVELTGYRHGRRRETRGFETLQRASDLVRPTDFGPRGARFQITFRTVEPASDLALDPYGLLNVHLNAYGHGNFEATETVRIRRYEWLRDQLQLDRGHRYFRHELTGFLGRNRPTH